MASSPGLRAGPSASRAADGNLYVLAADGSRPLPLTTDAGPQRGYSQLTWSPDGEKVAFLRYEPASPGAAVELYTALRDGSDRRRIYASDQAAPFYLYWAPGGEEVSFLEAAQSRRDLTLRIVPWRGGASVVVGTGQPYYWDWMPDGRALVTHTGGSAAENPEGAAITVFERSGMAVRAHARGPAPAFFQAPDVAPDGKTFAAAVFAPADDQVLARLAPPSVSLALVNANGGVERRLARLDGIAAFAWSPDGSRIALVDGATTPMGGIVGPLALVDPRDPGPPRPTGLSRVVCFSWSPDGRRLVAFVAQLADSAEPELRLAVFVIDAATAEATQAAVIRPTPQFLTGVVPFHDQYQRSSTMWSPDGSRIVVDAIGDDGQPGIYLLPADGSGPPRLVAEGVLPFWSPR